MRRAIWLTILAGLGVAATLAAAPAAIGAVPDLPRVHFKIVGAFSSARQFDLVEKQYYTKIIPERSAGRITADFISTDELGLKGFEIIRLLKQGMLDIGTATILYVSGDEPFFEGIDLAGLFPDIEAAHKGHTAYKPLMDERLQRKFGLKMLTLHPYPAQVIYCRPPVKSLADLKGKKVRVFGRTLGDLVEHVGGASVTIGWGEVYQALERGAADCAITGTLSGNTGRLYEVTTHLLTLPVGWATTMHTIGLAVWDRLDPKVKEFLLPIFAEMEQKLWDFGRESTQDGINCNTGVEPCKYGFKGKITLVTPSPADFALREEALRKTIIPRWVKRCGRDCVGSWNDSAGKVVGIRAEAP